MDHIVIYYSDREYECGMRGDVLLVEGDGKSHTCRCFLEVVMRVKPAHNVIVAPKSTYTKDDGSWDGRLRCVGLCCVSCGVGQLMVGWLCLRHGLEGFYCRLL